MRAATLWGCSWLRKAAILLALCAGGVVASAVPAPQAAKWTADPDDQYILDVAIRQLRLGDGVRAYNAPEGTCVVLGDFLTTLDVPMRIDLTAKRASGWAFTEKNQISIDYAAMKASFRGQSESLAPGTIRETPDGWCVQTSALARWFGIGVTPVTSGSVLVLQSTTKLPVELAMERQERAKHIKPASFDLSSLPQVRIPYRMWRAPALDFVVSAGATYRASDGVKVDRSTSVFAAGEIAHLSYDAQITTTQTGMPSLLRLRAYRSDPDGGLLGPLKATHFAFGDVEGFDSPLTGSLASGRGAVVTNRPLGARAAFDRTRFEGDLPTGWDAEVYRNGELLAFAKPSADQRYVFDNVQLLYGENRIEIVLYGPQGQIQRREEVVDVGQDNVPAGKTWYWVGANQPGEDIFTLQKPPDTAQPAKAQATVSLEHGLDDRTTVGVLARTLLVDDQRLTFVEGTVRRSIGGALLEVSGGRESNGGTAARAQLIGKLGPVNVSVDAILANDFHLRDGDELNSNVGETERDMRLSLDAPLKLGRTVLPAHADVHYAARSDGSKQLDAAARLSFNFNRFNLGSTLHYQKQYLPSGLSGGSQLDLELIGTARVGDVRLRGGTSFGISPTARLDSAELSAYWSASENADWEGDLVYEADLKRARARVGYIRRLNTMAIALTGEAASDGSVAFGINLNFSLDPRHGLNFSRLPLADAGIVHATVYRDLNDNGVHDPSEPFEKGALITTGTKSSLQPTDTKGAVTIGGLSAYAPIAVGIDETSLNDPMLVPKRALQVVVPRPGVPAEVEIGLVGGGDVEGALVKNGGVGFEGLDLELIDANGKVVDTTRTDLDGFFLFERVAYGNYSIRVATVSATAAKISSELGLQFRITADKAVVRLGTVSVTPVPQMASAASAAANP